MARINAPYAAAPTAARHIPAAKAAGLLHLRSSQSDADRVDRRLTRGIGIPVAAADAATGIETHQPARVGATRYQTRAVAIADGVDIISHQSADVIGAGDGPSAVAVADGEGVVTHQSTDVTGSIGDRHTVAIANGAIIFSNQSAHRAHRSHSARGIAVADRATVASGNAAASCVIADPRHANIHQTDIAQRARVVGNESGIPSADVVIGDRR